MSMPNDRLLEGGLVSVDRKTKVALPKARYFSLPMAGKVQKARGGKTMNVFTERAGQLLLTILAPWVNIF